MTLNHSRLMSILSQQRSPNIIRGGRTLEIELPVLPLKMKGFFTVELIDAKTKEVKFKSTFENTIVDSGLDTIYNTTTLLNAVTYVGVGTNNTTPAVGQTGLLAEITPRSSFDGGTADTGAQDAVNGYYKLTRTRLFTELQAVGNLAELGIFSSPHSSGTNIMFARQLFKDGVGTPIVVPKTIVDQLRITYELRMYYPLADIVGGILTINSVNYDYTIRTLDKASSSSATWAYNGAASVWAQSVGSAGASFWTTSFWVDKVSETNVLASSVSSLSPATSQTRRDAAAYGAGTFYREHSTYWDPGIANFATGVGSFIPYIGTASPYQVSFGTLKIPKINTQRLTFNYRHTWGRYP